MVEADFVKIESLLRNGMSQVAVSKELDASYEAIVECIKRRGLGHVTECRLTAAMVDQVKDLVYAGFSQKAIAEKYGVDPSMVSRYFKRHKIKYISKCLGRPKTK